MITKRTITALLVFLFGSATASASISDHSDVGGFKTFKDETTGYVWMDLDNFINMTTEEMIKEAGKHGFKYATDKEVHELLDKLPLEGHKWHEYKNIMGDSPERELTWGSFEKCGSSSSHSGSSSSHDHDSAWASDSSDKWSYGHDESLNTGNHHDKSIFAFMDSKSSSDSSSSHSSSSSSSDSSSSGGRCTSVSEPPYLALFVIGLIGLGTLRRRQPY